MTPVSRTWGTKRTTCLWLLACLCACNATPVSEPTAKVHDVVIYGATSAGIIAAIQAHTMGKSVVLLGPDARLGGLTTNGLGWTDSGDKAVIGGLSREFYRRLKQHYDRPEAWRQQRPADYSRYRPEDDAMWVFEPHVALQVFKEWIESLTIDVHRAKWLDRDSGVTLVDRQIQSIRMLDGSTYRGRMFIDATYEGDLLAAAGVSFHVGRESNQTYSETLNGVQAERAISHQFQSMIDPYVVPGDPTTGLLPRIHNGPAGKEGAADHRIQAYTYRLCMTDAPKNRVLFPKPKNYDPQQYELLLRTLLAGSKHVFGKIDPAPNRKTDTNNHGSFSTDNIGMNYDYPTASYARRTEILEEHRNYQQGYFYFLCTDPRVPEDVRSRMSQWGLAKDEFEDSGHWPQQIYVREARRMVSSFVMTERHVRGLEATPHPIGMGSYNMDSHHVQRYVAYAEDGTAYARNEGDLQINPGGPYTIAYDAIVPDRSECRNLLVPICLSSSHIAYGSIRMEPVFMILGQSAASAACLAIDQGCDVQQVDYTALESRLNTDAQVLAPLSGRVQGKPPQAIARQALAGLIIDDAQAILVGEWTSSTSQPSFLEQGYLHDSNRGKGAKFARFEVSVPEPGLYTVQLAYAPNPNRSKQVPVTIDHARGSTTMHVDQRIRPAIEGLFTSLGNYEFSRERSSVTIGTTGTTGYVIVDAVRFVRVK